MSVCFDETSIYNDNKNKCTRMPRYPRFKNQQTFFIFGKSGASKSSGGESKEYLCKKIKFMILCILADVLTGKLKGLKYFKTRLEKLKSGICKYLRIFKGILRYCVDTVSYGINPTGSFEKIDFL